MVLTHLAIQQRFPQPLPWDDEFDRAAHRTQRNYIYWVTGLFARWKRCTGHGIGKGAWSFQPLWTCHSLQSPMCSPTQKFSNPLLLDSYEFFITLTCLIKSLATGGLTQFPALLPSLEVGWGGAQSSNPPITWPGSTGKDLPSSGRIPKSPHWPNGGHLWWALPLGSSKGLRAPYQDQGQRPNVYIS